LPFLFWPWTVLRVPKLAPAVGRMPRAHLWVSGGIRGNACTGAIMQEKRTAFVFSSRRAVLGIFVASSLILLGVAPASAGAEPILPEPQGTLAPPLIATLDDVLAGISREVPGFAGAYFDETSQRLVVRFAGSTEGGDVRAQAVRQLLATRVGDASIQRVDVRVEPAQFPLDNLLAWSSALSAQALALPGTVSTDVDERGNRIRIGVQSLATISNAVRVLVRQLGIPSTAVVVEEVPPVRLELRDTHRPLIGGTQLAVDTGGGIWRICSLGFNATRAGVRGIVTNSHCTNVQGGVESTRFGQAEPVFHAATETVDPPLFTGSGCPAGRRCRYSDAAFAALAGNTQRDQGRIAYPKASSSTWSDSSIWLGYKKDIVAEANPLNGQSVRKIGRTTGRTHGTVNRTCVHVNVSGTNITLLCQAQASYGSTGGDSGGPVIRPTAGDTGIPADLVGIHWGSGGWFSPLINIQMGGELGGLTTCIPSRSC
jgi:hypothetical protein